jgi:hypothetical protein
VSMNIVLSAEGGAVLYGSCRDDAPAIKAVGGWKWSGKLKAWYLPRSWRDETVERKVRATVEALGCTVETETVETGEDRLARLADNAETRAERLGAKSERLSVEAQAHMAKARQIMDMIPVGQPILVGHHSERGHRRDARRIDDSLRRAVDASDEADRLADAARSAERTGERLADPTRRMARLVAIDKELSGQMTSDRRRERLEAEREALDAQLDRAVFASSETVCKGDIVRWKGQRAAVVRVNKTSVSVGHWQYGTGTGERFGPVDRPLVPVDPETGKAWRYTDKVPWHLIESVHRDGQVVFERGKH